jgi:serine O-acetyltransferase
MKLFKEIAQDAVSLTSVKTGENVSRNNLLRAISYDSFAILTTTRIRNWAQRWHIPVINRALRLCQMSIYGIEIAKEAKLGAGVNFVHSLGTVIGGNSQIGPRTVFLGNNTVGNLENRGYPTIGADVIVGAGARILGPIAIGDGAKIGANAVVVSDVPAGAIAVGIPAKCRPSM